MNTKLILLLALVISPMFSIYSQIELIKPAERQEKVVPYDSLQNSAVNPIALIGQEVICLCPITPVGEKEERDIVGSRHIITDVLIEERSYSKSYNLKIRSIADSSEMLVRYGSSMGDHFQVAFILSGYIAKVGSNYCREGTLYKLKYNERRSPKLFDVYSGKEIEPNSDLDWTCTKLMFDSSERCLKLSSLMESRAGDAVLDPIFIKKHHRQVVPGSASQFSPVVKVVSSTAKNDSEKSAMELLGRKVLYSNMKPVQSADYSQQIGKQLVANICINRLGNVIYAELLDSETTAIIPKGMRKSVLKAFYSYRFEPNKTGPQEQCGQVRYEIR